MNITKHAVVTMNYSLKNSEGTLLDSSEGREPLVYLHGVGGLVPGLETKLEGKVKGDNVEAIVAPEDAYGSRRDDLLKVVSKSGFQGEGGETIQVGMQVQLDTEHGPAIASITKIEGEDVTLDLNHPLADMTLHFNVDIVDVREGTEEEISHGHVHGPGGHQH
jgi:FKBP-type peptidyl-prolyl cis-trans isomerase SlyD